MSSKIIQALQSYRQLRTWKFWKEFLIMTLGMLITAIAVYYFLVPSKLIIGTTSGLAIVVSNVLCAIGLPVKISVCLTVINTLLLIIAFFLIDGEFGIKTVYASLILGPMIDLLDWLYPYTLLLIEPGQTSVMGDIWFDLCCFVLLLSAAQAMLFSINGSTGGLDIVAKILNKYTHTEMGTAVAVSGAIVSCTALAINPFRIVVVGLIGTWLNGVAIDYFASGISRRKRVCIITMDPEPIRHFIINQLVRGCSLYNVTGGYALEPHTEIQSLLTQSEFGDLMEFIRSQHIEAFITASNVSEVYGLWFSKSYRKHVRKSNHN